MATLDDGGGGGGGNGELVKSTLSLASRLNKRADLLRRILSFHETRNPKDYINLRSSSKLFHRALSRPPPLWTSFPNSNHTTLQSLVDRLEELRGDEESSGNVVPSVLFIEEGKYEESEGRSYVTIKKPLSIYGAGRGKTTLVGVGLLIKGRYQSDGIVEIEDLTIKGGKGQGLSVEEGMNVRIKRCSFLHCQGCGLIAQGSNISCNDLQVVGCSKSGVCASMNATITLSGEGTSIQGNVTSGYSRFYGLCSRRKIKLVAPLTKEQISTNNGGGGDWGGGGTIEVEIETQTN